MNGNIQAPAVRRPRFRGSSWTFEDLRDALMIVEEMAQELGMPLYRNIAEVVDQRRMFELLAVHGLPVFYHHWSFGRRYEELRRDWRRGDRGMVFEIVINSDPCRSFLLDVNTLSTQITVLAHAAVGHNAFFRNHRLMREWTRADFIVDYARFARSYIEECERRYGENRVEWLLDRAHTLRNLGIHRQRRRRTRREQEELERREREMRERAHSSFWNAVIPPTPVEAQPYDDVDALENNVLYWLEKNSRILDEWEREILRIVRVISEYFYPNMITKLANEGVATWTHYEIMTRLRDRGIIDDGIYQEFLVNHAAVVAQPPWNSPGSSINPYAIGFELVREAMRLAEEPTDEEARLMPGVCGIGRERALRDVLEWHTSESLIREYLTPRLLREFRLFVLENDATKDHYLVTAIHDPDGWEEVSRRLGEAWDPTSAIPDVRVRGTSNHGIRLDLIHVARRGERLCPKNTPAVLAALRDLWGGPVRIQTVDSDDQRTVDTHTIEAPENGGRN